MDKNRKVFDSLSAAQAYGIGTKILRKWIVSKVSELCLFQPDSWELMRLCCADLSAHQQLLSRL